MKMIIAAHHRCASTWVREIVEHYYPDAFISHRNGIPEYKNVMLYLNADYEFLIENLDINKYFILHIIRNPFDIIVSAYYSHLEEHSRKGWPELTKQRTKLRRVDRLTGLERTLEFLERTDFYDKDTPGPLWALDHWDFDDRRILTVRMEDLVRALPGFPARNASNRIGTWKEELPTDFKFMIYARYMRYVNRFYREMVKGF